MDPADRQALLRLAWSASGRYTTPDSHVVDRAALLKHLDEFRGRWPDARFTVAGQADQHHGAFHYDWQLVRPDRTIVREGTDFGMVAPDGRLANVTSFYRTPPASGTDEPGTG